MRLVPSSGSLGSVVKKWSEKGGAEAGQSQGVFEDVDWSEARLGLRWRGRLSLDILNGRARRRSEKLERGTEDDAEPRLPELKGRGGGGIISALVCMIYEQTLDM